MFVTTPDRPSLEALRQEHMAAIKELPPRIRQSQYLNRDCLECHRPRFRLDSRYCRRCHAYYAAKELADIQSGKSRDKNYAYTMPGWNNGLNAWVQGRDHYHKLEALAKLEGAFNPNS